MQEEDVGIIKCVNDSPPTVVSTLNGRLRIVQHNMGGISLTREQFEDLVVMGNKWLEDTK